MSYSQRAIEKCRNLFARGIPHQRVEEEMRKEKGCENWSRKNLYGERGWIEAHGFEDARRRYLQRTKQYEEAAENTANEMLTELIQIRKSLYKKISGNEDGDPQATYAYSKITASILQLLRQEEDESGDGIDLDSNSLYQVLCEIPDVRAAIEAHKEEILEKLHVA